MNNKGQALVEFVLILPIFLMILFAIIDFGMIFNEKSTLENASSDIINLLKNGEELEDIKDLYSDFDISVSNDEKYNKIVITNSIDLITPGLKFFIDDPYLIKVERIIPYA